MVFDVKFILLLWSEKEYLVIFVEVIVKKGVVIVIFIFFYVM